MSITPPFDVGPWTGTKVPGADTPRDFEKELLCMKAALNHTEWELLRAKAVIRGLRSGLSEIISSTPVRGDDAIIMAVIANDTLTGGLDE